MTMSSSCAALEFVGGPVAAVGEAKGGDDEARKQLLRRLSALIATPIGVFAIGFTLRHNRLKVYLLNACGLFHTNEVIVSEENGFLSTRLPSTVPSNTSEVFGLLDHVDGFFSWTKFRTSAKSIAWVEQSRNTDLAEIRDFAQEMKSRAQLIAVFRGKYETLRPAFLDRDHSFNRLVPRAPEVVIHEERYKSLDTMENTKNLARVLEGAIEVN
ncbi:BQ5605_C018g08604 [Microbotryum silenes-dioicae]|uniref:BQ5605_C018g08604 protein n=1 Tax=Microbotryum silenes-dioicae TaxID=796604 RepID=A0A2X0MRE6_9BASI|nr:BQ5605_C018g08604 [Microbotryum silenes-dioicae]